MNRHEKRLKILACTLLWLAVTAAGAAEGLLVWGWASGMSYLGKFGRAENPYVAEDVSTMGVLMVFQLILLLVLAFFAALCTHELKQRRKTDGNETTDNQ